MLIQRVITALIGLPLVVGVVAYGPFWSVALLVGLVCAACSFEMAAMLFPILHSKFSGNEVKKVALSRAIWIAACIGMVTYLLAGVFGQTSFLIFSPIFGMLTYLVIGEDVDESVTNILAFLVVIALAATPWVAVIKLYKGAQGPGMLLLMIAVVWSGDTAAYFGGKRFGKHKLAPKISPKKTREGAFFGVMASVLAALIIGMFQTELTPAQLIGVGTLGAVAGQVGDLLESIFKRFAHVKDSGGVLPGHGGILDRVDGILIAGPVVWAFATMVS